MGIRDSVGKFKNRITLTEKRPHRIAYKPHLEYFAYKVLRVPLKTITGNSRGLDLNFSISD